MTAALVNHSQMKLGKGPAVFDSRRLLLRDYIDATMPSPPSSVNWTGGVTHFGVLGNDMLGNCTIAAAMHTAQTISLNVDKQLSFTTQDAIDYYAKWDGYVPGDPSTDQGGIEPDVLNAWRKDKLKGHALLAYADPDPQNVEHVKTAVALLGNCYIGLQLPLSAQQQNVWDVVGSMIDPLNQPGSWGGHAVNVVGYNPAGLWVITWGIVKFMTWAFWKTYCDEAHALVLGYWFRNGASPAARLFGDDGIDEAFRIDQITKDALALAN